VIESQTLKGVIRRHLNLWAKWQDQKFKALVDSGATRNHILLAAIRKIGLSYRQKESLYLLVTISGDLILYRSGIIHFKTGPVEIDIKRRTIVTLFNVLLLGKDKAVLRIPFLQEFNLRIDWITGEIEI